MGWTSAIGIGANLLGGVLGGLGSRSAGRRQQQAGREANNLLDRTQGENYADLAPYRDMGAGATGLMSTLLGVGGDRSNARFGELSRRFTMDDYEADPGFQFRRDEGEKSINRNALAAGRYNSGSALKELQRYNSGLASQEFGNAFDRWRAQNSDIYGRLSDASGRGQRAVESGNADRSQLRGQMAQNIIGIGNSQAASRIGQTNALTGALGGAVDWWGSQNALRQVRTPGYFPGG
jgi:hypothetical protein